MVNTTLTAPVITQFFLATNFAALTGRSHTSNVFTKVCNCRKQYGSIPAAVFPDLGTSRVFWIDPGNAAEFTRWIHNTTPPLPHFLRPLTLTCVSWFHTHTLPL